MALRWPCFVLLLLAFAAPVAAAESDIKAELFADTSAIQAGKPFRLAVRLTPHTRWHIYWQNPGEAGLPTRVTFHLPPGFSAGPLQYPLPEKLILAGGIINYGYDHPTTFLCTITPPDHLPDGAPIPLSAAVSWLSCREVCVPGKATLELSLPPGTATPAHTELFDAAQNGLPTDTPPPAVASVQPAPAQGDHREVQIQWKEDVDKVDLFPLPSDNLEVTAIESTTHERQSTLSLNARLLAGQGPAPSTLPILIVFSNRAGSPRGFYTSINLQPPSTGSAH